MKMYPKICELCKKEFEGVKRRKFCSVLCACRAHAKLGARLGGLATKGKKNGQYRHGRRMNGQQPREQRECAGKVKYAISIGKLEKEPCKVCGEIKVEGHHKDYSKPYDVTWLCRKHHYQIHQIRPSTESYLKEVRNGNSSILYRRF